MNRNPAPLAARDVNGLAVIGRPLNALRGLRFAEGEGGDNPAAPAAPAAPAEPSAGAAPAAAPAAPAPAPAPAPAADSGDVSAVTALLGDKDSSGKPWTLDSAKAEIARLRRKDGDGRMDGKRRTAEALRQLASEVGIELPSDEPTVDGLSAELKRERDERESSAADLRNARLSREVIRAAAAAQIPADKFDYLEWKLSQSSDFQAIDPTAADFRDKITSTIATLKEGDSTLSAGPGSVSGAGQFGGANGTTAITQEQFDAMSYEARAELFHKNPAEYKRLSGN